MIKFKTTLIGFLGFIFVSVCNVSLAVLIYSNSQNKNKFYISIILLLLIIFSALACSFIDYLRRKFTSDKAVKEILYATKEMSKGNFNVKLKTRHRYQYYDDYDYIMDDLNMLMNELAKNEIFKNDFIANVSHELKTPLAIMQNYIKLLEKKDLTLEEKEKNLNNLKCTISKLNNLITNILKLNKLENQQLLPHISQFNLSELLINQIIQMEDIIEDKQIDLVSNIEENIFINSEPNYLEIVFNNLLSNAIKFTNKNGIIKISLRKINNKYIIKFEDNGCGMDKETGNRIFEKFYQGDTSHSKEGNGLGLALVKKVVDILGGSIEVESEKDIGSVFTITISEV